MRQAPALTAAVALAVAVALAACGEGATQAGKPAAAQGAGRAEPAFGSDPVRRGAAGVAGRCRAQLGDLLDVLDALRNQLAVGLSFGGYRDLVGDARSVYAAVPAGRLELACLALAARPAERALNDYIEGVNAWGECLAEASCLTASVEPRLQRLWERAARRISAAEAGLRGLRARLAGGGAQGGAGARIEQGSG